MTVSEYATLVYYWHGDPKPERLSELFSFLESAEYLAELPHRLGIAGVVLGLETMYPSSRPVWRSAHELLYERIDEAIILGGQYMADFFIGRWFILHDPAGLDELLDCVNSGGDGGWYARAALETAAAKCIPFDAAIKKAQRLRNDRMVLKTVH